MTKTPTHAEAEAAHAAAHAKKGKRTSAGGSGTPVTRGTARSGGSSPSAAAALAAAANASASAAVPERSSDALATAAPAPVLHEDLTNAVSAAVGPLKRDIEAMDGRARKMGHIQSIMEARMQTLEASAKLAKLNHKHLEAVLKHNEESAGLAPAAKRPRPSEPAPELAFSSDPYDGEPAHELADRAADPPLACTGNNEANRSAQAALAAQELLVQGGGIGGRGNGGRGPGGRSGRGSGKGRGDYKPTRPPGQLTGKDEVLRKLVLDVFGTGPIYNDRAIGGSDEEKRRQSVALTRKNQIALFKANWLRDNDR